MSLSSAALSPASVWPPGWVTLYQLDIASSWLRETRTSTSHSTSPQSVQQHIKAAHTIAIIGSGAVGVEIAMDIKSYYQHKQITIGHPHRRLLPHFVSRLYEYVRKKVEKTGVGLQLGERPLLPFKTGISNGLITDATLHFSDDSERHFDLIVRYPLLISLVHTRAALNTPISQIPCAGQRANSSFLKPLSPGSISAKNNTILVEPTLQLQDPELPHIFALSDVADTKGPKMARAGFAQADVVTRSIVALIEGGDACDVYVPQPDIEGSIKLTLGKVC